MNTPRPSIDAMTTLRAHSPLELFASTAAASTLAALTLCCGARADVPPTYPDQPFAEHWRNNLDIWLPPDACGPAPVVIFIHGGGWLVGDKSDVQPYVPSLLARGFAVSAFNYRFSYHANFPAQLHDSKAAVRFLRAHAAQYGLDPARVAVFGESAGGHLAALLGTTGDCPPALEGEAGGNLEFSSRVQAAAAFAAPIDLFEMAEYNASPTSESSLLIGYSIPEIAEHMKDPKYAELVQRVLDASPNTHATIDDPPHWAIHGQMDVTVPPIHAEILHNAVSAAGAASTLVLIDDVDHGIPAEHYEPVFDGFAGLLIEPPVIGDADCSGVVGIEDLLMVIGAWGPCLPKTPCPGDVTGDSIVGIADLLTVIGHWGQS